jgi:serine/threonine protein kinase
VLFEMVTGRRLFGGDTISDAIASVLRQEPDFDAAPAKARALLRRCLERDPQKRLRDIGDMELLLAEHSMTAPARRGWLWPGIAALAAVAAAAVSILHFRERPPAAELVRFEIEGPSNHTLNDLSLSPDGRQIASLLWPGLPETSSG